MYTTHTTFLNPRIIVSLILSGLLPCWSVVPSYLGLHLKHKTKQNKNPKPKVNSNNSLKKKKKIKEDKK